MKNLDGLSTKYQELTEDEMYNVDGGCCILIGACVCGCVVVAGGCAVLGGLGIYALCKKKPQ